MVRYSATVETPRDQREVFTYLSDFSSAREWDPGVIDAERLDAGPIDKGSRFHLVAKFLGRRTPLTYEVVEYRSPELVRLRAESTAVVSLDTISFESPAAGGTRVTYTAELTFKGIGRLLGPLLGLAFNRVGDRAAAGLRAKLGGSWRRETAQTE